jgi:hypothetical protein
MKPWLKYSLIFVAFVVTIIAASAVIFTQLYGDKLKKLLIEQLNNELLVKIEIKGDVKFVFWKDFPKATLEINQLVAHGSAPYSQRKMLRANRVYLNMSIYDLIKQNWSFNSIIIEKGTFDLFKDKQGKTNFQLVKENANPKNAKAIDFSIDKALLKKVQIKYKDETTDFITDVIINNATLKGNFKKETLFFNAEIESKVNVLSIKNETYFDNKNVALKGSLKIDTDKENYELKTDYVTIENNVFKVNGLIALNKLGTMLSLEIESQEITVKDAANLAPKTVADKLNEYGLDGTISGKVTIEGMLSAQQNPFINANINLKKSSFSIKEINSTANNFSANIQYNNGSEKNNKTSSLKILNIKGTIAGTPVSGLINVINFDNPNLHIEYKGDLDLGLLQPFIVNETVTQVKGLLKFENLLLKLNVNEIKAMNSPEDLQIQALFNAENVQLNIKDEDIIISEGKFSINYNQIDIEQAIVAALQSNLKLNLKLDNWKLFLFALNKNGVSALNQLLIDANVEADQLNWNNWQKFFAKEATPKNANNPETTFNSNQAGNLGGHAKVTIGNFNLDKFNAKQVAAKLAFTPNQIFLHNGSLVALGGDADTKGYFAFGDKKLEVNFSLIARNVEIKELFKSFDNFEQTTITQENLEGKLTADIKYSSVWNSGKFDRNSLYVYADMKIDNGKLLNFKPLESLSKFISIEELRNIKFATLKNTIEIKNQTITIPKMLINSSALSLSLNGTQTFSGNIDYHIKLNLFDVLGKKFGKNKQQFEFDEVDENNFNLYLSISGTIDKPIVKYDRSSIKDKMKQQKMEFKQFKEGTQQYNKVKETKDWETKEELKEIDWD